MSASSVSRTSIRRLSVYELSNAKIRSTHLGVNHTDHGILSFSITVEYPDGVQSFGQIVLDTVGHGTDKRRPTVLGSDLLLGVHEVFGLDWEELPGTPCQAHKLARLRYRALSKR